MVYVQEFFGSMDDEDSLVRLLETSGFKPINKWKSPAFFYDGVFINVQPINPANHIAKENPTPWGFMMELNRPLDSYSEDHPMFNFFSGLNSPKAYGGGMFAELPLSLTIEPNRYLMGNISSYNNYNKSRYYNDAGKKINLLDVIMDLIAAPFHLFRELIHGSSQRTPRTPGLFQPSANLFQNFMLNKPLFEGGAVYSIDEYLEKARYAKRDTAIGNLSNGTTNDPVIDERLAINTGYENGNHSNGFTSGNSDRHEFEEKVADEEPISNGQTYHLNGHHKRATLKPKLKNKALNGKYKDNKPLVKKTRSPRPKLEDEITTGNEIYRDISHGVFTPTEIRRFFTETLNAKLVVNGTWRSGSRKTPLEVYLVESKYGIATFTYKAEDYARSKKALLEASGDNSILADIASSLREEHSRLLRKEIDHKIAILEDKYRDIPKEVVEEEFVENNRLSMLAI